MQIIHQDCNVSVAYLVIKFSNMLHSPSLLWHDRKLLKADNF